MATVITRTQANNHSEGKMTTLNKNGTFLFLSDSDTESAKSRLAVSGIPYVRKRLESGASNWRKVVEIIDKEELLGVLVKLTNRTMRFLLHPSYAEVRGELLSRIKANPHIIFVHSSFFRLAPEATGSVEDDEDEWFGDTTRLFQPLDEEEQADVAALFEKYKLNIVPYRRNVELSLLAGDFVETHQRNLIFRFYIPSGKIYADQTADMLTLFRDYLAKSLKLQVRQTTHSTSRGTVYEFFGDGDLSQEEVTAKFSQFTEVMDLCLANPSSAEKLLVEQGADARTVGRLVTDYSKKLRRLTSDIRHERERKILDIRHRLEGELVDEATSAELDAIRLLVDEVIPLGTAVADVMGLGTLPLAYAGGNNLVVNVRPQFINHVQGVVAQELYGDQNIGPEPAQILELIRKSNFPNAVDLRSAVYELEDDNGLPEKRVSAGRRLQAFLAKMGDKAVDVGFGVLQTYIESKLGIK